MAVHLNYIHEACSKPFVWGLDDCATFVLDWIDLASGSALGRAWRGNYTNKETAQAFADNNGGFVAMAKATLSKQCRQIDRSKAQSGDACLVRNNSNAVMGIIDEDRVFLRSGGGFLMLKSKPLFVWSSING